MNTVLFFLKEYGNQFKLVTADKTPKRQVLMFLNEI